MDEDTEVTPQSSVGWRLKLPLPAPVESVSAPEDLDDLETLPRTAPVPAPPKRATEPPLAIPHWALIASSALLCAAVATTVALVF